MIESSPVETIESELPIELAGQRVLETSQERMTDVKALLAILKAFGRPIQEIPESELI